LLAAYVDEQAIYYWTYTDFEMYAGQAITPSMYAAMAKYVKDHIPQSYLYMIDKGEFFPRDINANAVEYYYNLPSSIKEELHDQEILRLEKEEGQEQLLREERWWHNNVVE